MPILCWLLWIGQSCLPHQAEAQETLARLVPAEAALFIELPQLNRHLDELIQPQYQALVHVITTRSPLAQVWQDWLTLERSLSQQAQISLAALLRRAFQERVALALMLPADGKPQGLFLAQANDPHDLHKLLEVWDLLEPPASREELRLGDGRLIIRKILRGNKTQTLFVGLARSYLFISDVRELVEFSLSHVTDHQGRGTLAREPRFQRYQPPASADVWCRVWMDTNSWDHQLIKRSADELFERYLQGVWKSLDTLDVVIMGGHELHIDMTARWDVELLTPAWKSWVQQPVSPLVLPPPASSTWGMCAIDLPLIPLWHGLHTVASANEKEQLQRFVQGLQGIAPDLNPIEQFLPTICSVIRGYVHWNEASARLEAALWIPQHGLSHEQQRQAFGQLAAFFLQAWVFHQNYHAGSGYALRRQNSSVDNPVAGEWHVWRGPRLVAKLKHTAQGWLLGTPDAHLPTNSEETPSASPAPSRSVRALFHAEFVSTSWKHRTPSPPPHDDITRWMHSVMSLGESVSLRIMADPESVHLQGTLRWSPPSHPVTP